MKQDEMNQTSAMGTRHNEGKPRWSLVDFDALEPMVRVLEYGAKKYGENNWKKGLKTTEICESLLRHIFAYLRGEDIDPESGLPQIGLILSNAKFLSYMTQFRPDCDTRYRDTNKKREGIGTNHANNDSSPTSYDRLLTGSIRYDDDVFHCIESTRFSHG